MEMKKIVLALVITFGMGTVANTVYAMEGTVKTELRGDKDKKKRKSKKNEDKKECTSASGEKKSCCAHGGEKK